ncbi:hypothetical protein N7481_010453 [Penicillium waksmanii]|uniref:uncharacterized protein n=1 Tax=Penicillium waksmanii TaxID=69791 RepID=UPI002547F13B|nr:uncharacterized protein N7481_010453 [Penicillium waksmanii]KAJ5973243.1 hypothetical protein N7481_010453 [Penicillium waksmanii]
MASKESTQKLAAEVQNALNNLHGLLLGAASCEEIALARAIYHVLLTEWSARSPNARVFDENIDTKPTTSLKIANWHNHAVERATEILSWQATPPRARKRIWESMRKAYEVYIQRLEQNFESWNEICRKLSRGPKPRGLKKADQTTIWMMLFREEVLAWFDFQRATTVFVLKDPGDGIVQFLTERKEMLMLFKTIHVEGRGLLDWPITGQVLELQAKLSPTLRRLGGLYAAWNIEQIVGMGEVTETERAVLAMGVLVPGVGRLVKAGRLMYSTTRLTQLFGSNFEIWELAIFYSAQVSRERLQEQALDSAMAILESGKRLPKAKEAVLNSALEVILGRGRLPEHPEPLIIEKSVTDLWADLLLRHPWLASSASLDDHALRRILLMGTNYSHLQSQLLAELAESRICAFMRDKKGLYSLGISVPADSTLDFVPGHAFRLGNTGSEIDNRQISDGVLGYWRKGIFVVAAILEVKVEGLGGRELGHNKSEFYSLTRREQQYLRAYSNRERVEMKETAERTGEELRLDKEGLGPATDIEVLSLEILKSETGSQITRDISRLDNFEQGRINGILAPFQLAKDAIKPTKILFVVPKGLQLSDQIYVNLKNEVENLNTTRTGKPKIPFHIEPFAVPFEASQLKGIVEEIIDDASKMIYSSGAINDSANESHHGASTGDFIMYLKRVYAIALDYKTGREGANQRVVEWLRFLEYNDMRWDRLVGSIDNDWITHILVKDKDLKRLDFVTDPLHPINVKVSHWGAAIDGVLKRERPTTTTWTFADIAGWGGDLIQLYSNWQASEIRSGSEYCWRHFARPGDTGGFKLRDLIEDADGFNIGTALLTDQKRSILDEVEDLLTPRGEI